MRWSIMVRPVGVNTTGRALVGAGVLVASFLFATAGATAPTRAANSCGPCRLVATMKSGDQRVLFDATAASTPVERSQTSPFRADDHWTWRLTSRIGTSSVDSAVLRLGDPSHPGQTLFTLCRPCLLGAGGHLQLGSGLAGVLNRGVTCHTGCPPAEAWPVGAYLLVKLTPGSAVTLTGQLRYCAPNQYRHRNSCSPPGY